MDALKKIPDKGDPSDIIQLFPRYNLQLHCCRYWWLQHWEFKELSFPYWRIYHNSYQGAMVMYDGKEYALTPDKVVMIAPNTAYATRMYDHKIPEIGYSLKGGRVSARLAEMKDLSDQYILHLFIHFNIGMPYDNISPGIYIFDLTEHLREKLQIIKRHLNYENARFSFYSSLAIQSLIGDLLAELPEESWDLVTKNHRILEVLNYVEMNVGRELNNQILANRARLATNAFTRLFTEEIGVSPQKYVKRKRIDKACILLHHSNMSIDEVAVKTGFADRYHFSRIFKQLTSIAPAKYRKEYGIK
ncbi:helix-turn-helix domain-containing protein [Saccharicrinis fermentans]|nr:helix-turn-helix domain-containing protein [Saccharicrinis fermentans]